MMFALLLANRYLVSWLRRWSVLRVANSDELLTLHKLSGIMMVLAGLAHTIGHAVTLSKLKSLPDLELEAVCEDNDLHTVSDAERPMALWPYLSGIFIWLCLLVIAASGLNRHFRWCLDSNYVRRFSIPHSFGTIALAGFLGFHGFQKMLGSWIAPYFLGPAIGLWLICWLWDRCTALVVIGTITRYKPPPELPVQEDTKFLTVLLPIEAKHAARWRNRWGDYVLLYMPVESDCLWSPCHLRLFDWHPFSIADIQEHDNGSLQLQLVIQIRSGWTKLLSQHERSILQEDPELRPVPRFIVRGPFRSEAGFALDQENVLFYATGVGATAMWSVLKAVRCCFSCAPFSGLAERALEQLAALRVGVHDRQDGHCSSKGYLSADSQQPSHNLPDGTGRWVTLFGVD